MPVTSAGLLLHRRAAAASGAAAAATEVLIAHMGGPYWARKDAGAWSIPKGEYDPRAETAVDAAVREFGEELGVAPPPGPYLDLGEFAYSSGKRVAVFAADGAGWRHPPFVYGEFELEWPPRSGRTARFPEVDRAEWVAIDRARDLLVTGQRPVLDALRDAGVA